MTDQSSETRETLRWEAPPDDLRGGRRWHIIAATLRERPNEWALIRFVAEVPA